MMIEIKEMNEMLSNAKSFRYDGYLYHVLGIFDDENVAVKYYGKHKQFWHYEFMDSYFLYLKYRDGLLTIE